MTDEERKRLLDEAESEIKNLQKDQNKIDNDIKQNFNSGSNRH